MTVSPAPTLHTARLGVLGGSGLYGMEGLEDIQELTDAYCVKVDQAMAAKEKDILEI